MELITIYFIALAWCGLGMVGAQLNYYSRLPLDVNYGLKYFINGIIFGPLYLLQNFSLWFLTVYSFNKFYD